VVLRLQFGWTWEDLKRAIDDTDGLIGSVAHRVDLIIDLSESTVPRDFLNGAKDLFAQGEARANEGQRIVVGAGWPLRAAYQSLRRVYGAQLAARPFQFANTLEDALLLRQKQP
jgi:hypothetical protein